MRAKEQQQFLSGLPAILPVFPLTGVLLLPRGELPLNIFEPRNLAMVDDALKTDRLIGIIQPRRGQEENGAVTLYDTGCAGKITAFSETGDGRYLITLTGVCRFRVEEERPLLRGYRRVTADWSPYAGDAVPADCLGIDRDALKKVLAAYFDHNGLSCDWDVIDGTPDDKLITCLSMICPFDPEEKQALLEAPCGRQRAERFMTMLRMAVYDKTHECSGCH